MASHPFVADAARKLGEPRFQMRPPLRRIETARFDLPHPQHLGERPSACEHIAHRGRAAGADEVVGIMALRQRREAQALAGLQQRQRETDGAIGRPLAGVVAVEQQDRFVGDPPQHCELILGERGSERRDGRRKSGGRHRDHVDIAFDHDQRRARMGRGARCRAVVEGRAFVEERRFR